MEGCSCGVEQFGDRITVVFESGEENELKAELFELLERPKCFQTDSNVFEKGI